MLNNRVSGSQMRDIGMKYFVLHKCYWDRFCVCHRKHGGIVGDFIYRSNGWYFKESIHNKRKLTIGFLRDIVDGMGRM